MPPEMLQSLADEHGLPVQHFDGYSVVHGPSGPMTIAHSPRVAVASAPLAAPPPSADSVPPSLARPPEPPASIATTPQQQRADALRREAAAQRHAYDTDQRTRQLQAEEDAQLAAIESRIGRTSEPDQFGIVTHTYPGGRVERTGPPGAFELERRHLAEVEAIRRRSTPTSAGTRTFPDGSTVTTDDQGRSVMPPIDMERLRAEMGDTGGDRGALGGSGTTLPERLGQLGTAARTGLGYVASPEVQSLVDSVVPTSVAEAQTQASPMGSTIGPDGVPSMLARPPEAMPTAPTMGPAVHRRVGGGGPRTTLAPAMTLPDALDVLAGTPQARGAFDQTIAGLADGHVGRRDPDLIDRQALVEMQRAGLAERAARTQAQIEAQAEAERQQLERDRQQATAQARQRYQNAIDRVSQMHLDPQRWFRDQDAAGTVTSVIAVALGALGQALTGSSTNGALEQINQAIDRDMQAQQSEIDSAQAGADMQGNMINVMRQEFNDRDAAHSAARAAMLQQAALHVQEMEGSLAGQDAQNNADALRAQLEAQAAEARQAAEQQQSQIDMNHARALRDLATAAETQRRTSRSGAGSARPPHITSTMLSTADAIFRAADGGVSREEAARLAGIPEEASFIPQASPEADTQRQRGPLNAALSELERSIPAGGDIPGVGVADSRAPGWMLSEEGRRMRSLAQRTLIRMLRVDSGGVIGADEVAQYADMYGLSPGSTEQQFRDGVAAMRADFDAGILGSPHSGAATDHDHAEVGFTPR